ncbi:ketoacyl-ACP synthase III [Chryseolinea sp. H1M3-3]|uniref:3-oxoacyl-ACP synthase III family protein n=1 Tax=Chryseolinea sp. H1M3-3 TaxID=3034144 RepID=UPI0023EAAB93|nr:ketoacyl-ACP synthase III [Chryseolinea sp. H1M3-3]
MINSTIVGTGCYIPEVRVRNEAFSNVQFFEKDGTKMYKSNRSIIDKFQEITGIEERRYARPEQNASDLAFLAASDALETSGIDRETLDYIIVAHNFGDVSYDSNRVSLVPSLGSRVKAMLGIQNPDCVAYDLSFGCPGWLEGVIQANYYIKSGDAKRCLVIGTETLSRVTDTHDLDSMIYSDGSGAIILQASLENNKGIISHKTQTHAIEHSALLNMAYSYSPYNSNKDDLFIKMNGRKVYEFAMKHVPFAIKSVLDKAGVSIESVSKILIHQANEKLDNGILERLFKLYEKDDIPQGIMPMSIGWLGNSSVATIPTLLDLILKGKLKGHTITNPDTVVMASVGAGMNINAVVYQF